MKQLVELNLGSNQIREISELGNLTNLSKLSLTSNKINDVSVIGKLTNLQKLELQKLHPQNQRVEEPEQAHAREPLQQQSHLQ
ncbi:leucine-rich_repeat domain-containing protein [Hexamita inflata]|uniref:Leucine-rich repeat domain-containing protein n=1 Tax=Hexamita inflata TaxID=28002 RepID=A0AA86TZ22_9EUKA|nr:leucine-rich repeat domain-containing protein [Hexamita inflata]